MFAKLFVIASAIAAVYCQADRYPAGVNPSLCPNYPHCDNSLLAAYNAPHLRAAIPAPAPVHHAVAAHAPAHQYPAGVNPASCPNYPYCTGLVGAAPAVAPLPGFSARLYPDGVNPSICPNYPYCH